MRLQDSKTLQDTICKKYLALLVRWFEISDPSATGGVVNADPQEYHIVALAHSSGSQSAFSFALDQRGLCGRRLYCILSSCNLGSTREQHFPICWRASQLLAERGITFYSRAWWKEQRSRSVHNMDSNVFIGGCWSSFNAPSLPPRRLYCILLHFEFHEAKSFSNLMAGQSSCLQKAASHFTAQRGVRKVNRKTGASTTYKLSWNLIDLGGDVLRWF